MFRSLIKTAILVTLITLIGACGPAATVVPPTATIVPALPTAIPPTVMPSDVPPTEALPTATSVPTMAPTSSPPTATPPSDEPPAISWLSTYGNASNNVGNVVLQADDGGYFIAGATGLQSEPNPQGDIYLIRTDPTGEILWERTFGGADYEAAFAMIRAGDGNLVIAGGTSSHGAGEVDIYLLKVDQNGNEIWSKTFGGTQDDEAVDVHQTQDGGYILIGYTRIAGSEGDIEAVGNIGAGESYIYLVKTDGEGNELWSGVYTGENGEQVYTSAGLPTADGGFLVLARINPNANHNTFLLKVDADGNEAWSRAWETENLRAGNDIIPTSDGNYFIAGLSEASDGRCSSMLMKVDPDGNELWVNVIDDGRFGYARTAIELPDRGFVVLGFSGRDPLAGLEVLTVDEDGQLIWTENYASQRLVHGNSILLHPEGDILIAGEADARGGMDVFLARLEMPASPVPPTEAATPRPTEAATPLPTDTPTPLPPLGGSGGGVLAFSSRREGSNGTDIYVMNADGTGQRQLTDNPGDDLASDWSPDGQKLAFHSNRDGHFEIYVMNADGSAQQRLTFGAADNMWPTWSPDGEKIAFQSRRDGHFEIYLVNADGTGAQRLTNTGADSCDPDWSPDGVQIAFDSKRDGNLEIYVMDADGSNVRRLTNNPAMDRDPAWSPDGKRIAFMSGAPGLYLMPADGSNVTALPIGSGDGWSPTWSPDGTGSARIAFYSYRPGPYSDGKPNAIYVVGIDGSNLRQLTELTTRSWHPVWRP